MLRMHVEVAIPKAYQTHCKFMEYFKRRYNTDYAAALLEEKNVIAPFKYSTNPSMFTRILEAVKECTTNEIHLLYTTQTNLSFYIGITKLDGELFIILLNPYGITNAVAHFQDTINALRKALNETEQYGKLYINTQQTYHDDITPEYFTHYFAEYFMTYGFNELRIQLPAIKVREGNLGIVAGAFLPKALSILTQSGDDLVNLLPDDSMVNLLLDNAKPCSFAQFKALYFQSGNNGSISNDFMRCYQQKITQHIKNISIADPLKYQHNAINALVSKIEDDVRLDLVL